MGGRQEPKSRKAFFSLFDKVTGRPERTVDEVPFSGTSHCERYKLDKQASPTTCVVQSLLRAYERSEYPGRVSGIERNANECRRRNSFFFESRLER